jgi:gamma-glutamylcyclotransferase
MPPRSLYFAYGSNLSPAQMRARCPGSQAVGTAVLPNYALAFGGYSFGWGGAVATIERTPGAQVEGLVYLLTRADLMRLDGYEGHPFAYRRQKIKVLNSAGHWRRAYTYAQPVTEPTAPPLVYLAVIVREYHRLGFDVGALAVAAQMRAA